MLQQGSGLRSCLSVGERRVLTAIARVAMPAGELLPAAGAQSVARVEDFFASLSATAASAYRGLLWAVEGASWLSHRRSFADLDAPAAEALLESWRQGDYLRRNLLRALLTPLKLAHYDDPTFYKRVGCVYSPPPGREERPRWMTERMLSPSDVAGETLECDVVVVGTGAGGAVVARELAERGVAVVMLEEGEYFGRADFTGRPVAMQRKMYRGFGALWSVGNVAIPIPVGKTVGGTTTVNSGSCYRAPERVLAGWRAQHGLSGFSSDTMAPFYERVEGVMRVAPSRPEYLGGVARLVAAGCDALGYSHSPIPRNAPDCDGQGVCCFGCPTDAKRSTNVSYVPLALQRGATLVKGIRVERILVENGRAVGVMARARGESVTVRARAVVIACGSLLTPVLLEKNGLAGGSGQLGRNLSIHPAAGLTAIFDELVEGYKGVPQGYAIDQFADEGMLFEGVFAPPEMGAISTSLLGHKLVEMMEAWERLASFGFMIADTSRGRVRGGSGDQPLITYSLNDTDVARLKRGCEILARVLLAAGARRVLLPVHGWDEITSTSALARFASATLRARDFELSAYHPLGTARMGRDPRSSVVGPDCQTHDTPGLYVADGSVVPSALGVNPQMTIMALATRAADQLAERLT